MGHRSDRSVVFPTNFMHSLYSITIKALHSNLTGALVFNRKSRKAARVPIDVTYNRAGLTSLCHHWVNHWNLIIFRAIAERGGEKSLHNDFHSFRKSATTVLNETMMSRTRPLKTREDEVWNWFNDRKWQISVWDDVCDTEGPGLNSFLFEHTIEKACLNYGA